MTGLPYIGQEGVLLNIFFRNIANKLTDGIAIISENFTVMLVNPSFQNIFGFPMQELTGKKIDDFIVLEKDKEESLEFKQKVINGESIKIEKAIRKTKDDQIIAVEIVGIPVGLSRGRKAIILIYKDITTNLNYIKQKVINYRIDAFETMARGIIINLKSIMTRINRYISLGWGHFRDPVESKKQFNNAKKSVIEANLLAKQFIAFIKNKDLMVTNSIEDLDSLITFSWDNDLEKVIDPKANSDNSSNSSNLKDIYGEDELLPLIIIRKSKMFEVINNLIEEIQHIHKGEDINIDISRINVDRRNPVRDLERGDYIKLFIELIGIDLSQRIIRKILKPYLEEAKAPKDIDFEFGSVYSILKNHIGYLAIDSKGNKGTDLIFYIPIFY
ncbi:MAG: PAS domain S-box protein [Candidatus Cloacimonetes bacterium]|nr:PAS domain S-box protein [Candidatus Cloacimonadota bacterium]